MPLEIFPYQAEGADWLARRERAGLFDEMGVGKTATAIRALDLRRIKRGICIVPANLRENWRGEFRKFAQVDRHICKAVNIHDFVAWSRGRFDVLVTSYELATRWVERIHEMGEIFDFLIIDEGHYLKNDGSQRSRAILGPHSEGQSGILQWAEQAWILTGTPMANDPLDIYTFLRFARCMPLSKPRFIDRYFYARTGTWSVRTRPRPETLSELQQLIGNNSIRRTQKQVGLQLPEIFLTTALVDGDTQAIRDWLRQFPGLEASIVKALNQGGLSFIDAQHVATLRRLVGEAKAFPYAELLLNELRGGLDKAVVFGLHRQALLTVRDYLVQRNIHAVILFGDTPEKQRTGPGSIVETFQTDPKCRVFIGQIRAAGVGLTLTAAASVDMLESDWSPAGNAQAIKRIHRIGQLRRIRARFITLARSIDETVNAVVAEKTAAIAAIEGVAMTAMPPMLDAQAIHA